ncbi:putative wall-associated receptor kinase, galacturonan-binding domain-containing protein [Rosa chinensis]|uniref:Putative wall-associated receptor kinase, galacturonan-binding domain-containing protein n=1 Tax=Rosa chinensis TaxID=74649 RepID=A0A2P6Q6D0_ROSCH|nr:putative wall-associated receptor kinase, galacturonan-binding domain-containing protein [Rosa chinensis]
MASLHRMLLMQLCLMGLVATQTLPPQAKLYCLYWCGNVQIPYPFGIGDGCYLPTNTRFNLSCNLSTTPPSTRWTGITLTITDISLAESELQIITFIAKECYNEEGEMTYSKSPSLRVSPAPYTISDTKNKFFTVCCDTYALFQGYRDEKRFQTGCMSLCDDRENISDSCSGVGCCETAIPSGLKNRTIRLSSYYNNSYIMGFNPCSYAFIVQDMASSVSPRIQVLSIRTTLQSFG